MQMNALKKMTVNLEMPIYLSLAQEAKEDTRPVSELVRHILKAHLREKSKAASATLPAA